MTGHVWHETMRRSTLQLAVLVTQRCAECGDWVMVTATSSQARVHGRLFAPQCSGVPQGFRRYKATVFYRGKWIQPDTLPDDIIARLEDLKREAFADRCSRWRTLDPED